LSTFSAQYPYQNGHRSANYRFHVGVDVVGIYERPFKIRELYLRKQCRRKNVGKIVTHPLSIGQKRCAQVTTGSTKPICFEQV
jgi:hypothetical protein